MFPFWIDFSITTVLQMLALFGVACVWWIATLTGRHCGM